MEPSKCTGKNDFCFVLFYFTYSKTCLKRPLKYNRKVLKTNGSLMKVASITECYLESLVKNNFGPFFEWPPKTARFYCMWYFKD